MTLSRHATTRTASIARASLAAVAATALLTSAAGAATIDDATFTGSTSTAGGVVITDFTVDGTTFSGLVSANAVDFDANTPGVQVLHARSSLLRHRRGRPRQRHRRPHQRAAGRHRHSEPRSERRDSHRAVPPAPGQLLLRGPDLRGQRFFPPRSRLRRHRHPHPPRPPRRCQPHRNVGSAVSITTNCRARRSPPSPLVSRETGSALTNLTVNGVALFALRLRHRDQSDQRHPPRRAGLRPGHRRRGRRHVHRARAGFSRPAGLGRAVPALAAGARKLNPGAEHPRNRDSRNPAAVPFLRPVAIQRAIDLLDENSTGSLS